MRPCPGTRARRAETICLFIVTRRVSLGLSMGTSVFVRFTTTATTLPTREILFQAMNINTVETKLKVLFSLVVFLVVLSASATTHLSPWTPIFKGVEHAVGTNTPGDGGFPDLHV